MTLKATPAAWAVGVPLLPVELPGTALSPGTSNCSFTNAPAFTIIGGLVLGVLAPSVMSLAVKVHVPAVRLVRASDRVPDARAVFAGKTELVSVEVRPTVWVMLVTTFQFASTALTITL